ncbi:hypothetical protein ACHAPQ_009926, partial [Fusarium lateritium]
KFTSTSVVISSSTTTTYITSTIELPAGFTAVKDGDYCIAKIKAREAAANGAGLLENLMKSQ